MRGFWWILTWRHGEDEVAYAGGMHLSWMLDEAKVMLGRGAWDMVLIDMSDMSMQTPLLLDGAVVLTDYRAIRCLGSREE